MTLMGCGTCDPDNFSGRLKLPSQWLKILSLPFEVLGCFCYVTVVYPMCIQGIEETKELVSIRHELAIAKINLKAEKELTQYSLKWDQLRYEKRKGLFEQIFKEYCNIQHTPIH